MTEFGSRPGSAGSWALAIGAWAAAAILSVSACASRGSPADDRAPAGQEAPQVNPIARSFGELQARVEEYVALRRKVDAAIPALPGQATPEQIDARQRELARRVQQARGGSAVGSVFTRESRGVIRGLMKGVFAGPDGARLKATIMEENPGRLRLTANSRYPDDVPLSTVPARVLAGLPALPPEIEYRFVGRALILLDTRAHLIIDLIENAIP